MPLFDFQCQHCGHTEEQNVRITAKQVQVVCPKCGENMCKLISAPATIEIRGDGGYKMGAVHRNSTKR